MGEKEEEYIEIDSSKITEENRLLVKVEKLSSYKDVEKIIDELRNNKLVLIRISEIRKKSEAELKRSVDKIKKFIDTIEGEIVGIGDDIIVAAPRIVKILK